MAINSLERSVSEDTMSLLVTAIVAALLSTNSAPQTRSDTAAMLVGRVIDATDSAGIAGANVQIAGTSLTVRTDGRGLFRLRGISPGSHQVEVRAFRYSPDTMLVKFVAGDSVRLSIYMKRVPQLLSEMVVQGRALRVPRGFEAIYARGARGWGKFITAEQIDSLGPKDIKTMFEGISGVVVTQRGVYFNRCSGNPIIWPEWAELWVDGDRVTRFNVSGNPTDPREMNDYLENIPPSDVQAIEVYTSSVNIPVDFASSGSPCAVIAVWRKR
jgi:hypothetical protein